jgi:hypothetical protein
MASGMGHGEQDVIAYAQANNWEMVTVAAGCAICRCVSMRSWGPAPQRRAR